MVRTRPSRQAWAVMAFLLGGLGASPPARADDDATALGIQVRNAVEFGKAQPALLFRPARPVESLTVTLARQGDAVTQTLTLGALKSGQERVAEFEQPVGAHSYEATLKGRWKGGKAIAFGFGFEAKSVQPLEITVSKADIDLEKRVVQVRLSRPAGEVRLEVFGDGGQRLAEVAKTFSGEPAGTRLAVSWPARGSVVERINIRGVDELGFWAGLELTPFMVHIPHDEVVFEFGKWDVRPSEEGKLRDSLQKLREALQRHGKEIQIQLYIAGYTDTVGSKSANLDLSHKRAQAIAAWFKRAGVGIDIFCQGFGEDVPAVATPDETAEERNRRAIYVLSAGPPAVTPAMPQARWQAL